MEAITQFATTALGTIAAIPILAIFFLSDGQRLADSVIRLVAGKNNYQRVQSLVKEVNVMLQHYIRGNVLAPV